MINQTTKTLLEERVEILQGSISDQIEYIRRWEINVSDAKTRLEHLRKELEDLTETLNG